MIKRRSLPTDPVGGPMRPARRPLGAVAPYRCPPDVQAALRRLRDRQGTAYGFVQVRDGFVAVDEHGQTLRPERWSDMWAQLCAEADIRPLTLHAARHTSVTHMRSRGVPDQITAAWHGHDETIMRRSTRTRPRKICGRRMTKA